MNSCQQLLSLASPGKTQPASSASPGTKQPAGLASPGWDWQKQPAYPWVELSLA